MRLATSLKDTLAITATIILDILPLSFLYLLEVLHECTRKPEGTTKMKIPVLCVTGMRGHDVLWECICYWKAVTKVCYSTQALQIFS